MQHLDIKILTCTEVYDFRIGEITETKSRQIDYLYVRKIRDPSEYTVRQNWKDFARFHGDCVNPFDVGSTCLPA